MSLFLVTRGSSVGEFQMRECVVVWYVRLWGVPVVLLFEVF